MTANSASNENIFYIHNPQNGCHFLHFQFKGIPSKEAGDVSPKRRTANRRSAVGLTCDVCLGWAYPVFNHVWTTTYFSFHSKVAMACSLHQTSPNPARWLSYCSRLRLRGRTSCELESRSSSLSAAPASNKHCSTPGCGLGCVTKTGL